MVALKVQVEVGDLEHGMFVCELDRPWTDTSFLLQGVLIESVEDMAEFRRKCEYVYIDVERSRDSTRPRLESLAEKNRTRKIESPPRMTAALVEQFIKCLGIYPIGSMVELNTGHIGVVVSASEKARLRPLILLVKDRHGKRYAVPKLINLAHPHWNRKENLLEVRHIVSDKETDIHLPQRVANQTVL